MAYNFLFLIWLDGYGIAAFRPSGITNYWKNTIFCNFLSFWHTYIFFLLIFIIFFFLNIYIFFSFDFSHVYFLSIYILIIFCFSFDYLNSI